MQDNDKWKPCKILQGKKIKSTKTLQNKIEFMFFIWFWYNPKWKTNHNEKNNHNAKISYAFKRFIHFKNIVKVTHQWCLDANQMLVLNQT